MKGFSGNAAGCWLLAVGQKPIAKKPKANS